MTAQKLDGKATAAAIKSELAERVAALRDQGVVPGLGTVLVGEDPASHQYVAGKHRDCAQVGIESIRVDLPADVTEEELAQKIRGLNANPHCTGYIVQLPLPRHIDTNWALNLIDPNKDADGLTPASLGRLVLNEPAPLPCTPRGIVELLTRHGIELPGANVLRGRTRYDGGTSARAAADPSFRETAPSPCVTPGPVTLPNTPGRPTSLSALLGRRDSLMPT